MPNQGTPEGRQKVQLWILTELVAELDALCQEGGRISRRRALELVWPEMLAALRARLDLPPKP